MKFSLFFWVMLLCSSQLLWGQTIPAAGDILFTHADADVDGFEFITLKRLRLDSLRFTDNGICSSNLFRKNEQTFTMPVTGFSDIPAGTLVRIVWGSSTGINDSDQTDGVVQVFANTFSGGGSPGLNASGEQIISFMGSENGAENCGGSGTNSYISGFDWAKTSGWIATGATAPTNSKAPGTATDMENKNNLDATWFNTAVSGNVAAIIAATGTGVRNEINWSGTNTGTGTFLPLKNIQLHASNYANGLATASSGGGNNSTLNLSGLNFSNSSADTRYLVLINESTSSNTPANRYTCYTPNTNFSLAANVVTAVSTPPCTGPTLGIGKVVYFNYTLPSNLSISGLNNNTCYHVSIYAINGNGYSANLSSIPASINFFTGNLSSSITAY